jgi:hypothetical protein
MTAQTTTAPMTVAVPSVDPRVAVVAVAAVATAIGVVLAPALTFFVALAIVVVIGLDRAGRAADEEIAAFVSAQRDLAA